jgi:hypothetical protein
MKIINPRTGFNGEDLLDSKSKKQRQKLGKSLKDKLNKRIRKSLSNINEAPDIKDSKYRDSIRMLSTQTKKIVDSQDNSINY